MQFSLILAVFAQGFLAFALLILLGFRRLPRITSGEIDKSEIALDSDKWPEDAQKAANAFRNQFQLPVLFYVAVGLAISVGVEFWDVVAAWVFVASRYTHAGIHVSTNNVVHRFSYYVIGFGVLGVWWIALFIRYLLAVSGV